MNESEIRHHLLSWRVPDGGLLFPKAALLEHIHYQNSTWLIVVHDSLALGCPDHQAKIQQHVAECLKKISLNQPHRVIFTAERSAPALPPLPVSKPSTAAGQMSGAVIPPIGGIKKIIAVASGKGGVGKSTVATNLALAFVGLGLRVGILDADIYGPSQPTMLGISGQKPIVQENKKFSPPSAYGLACMSMGFLLDTQAPLIWRGPMVMGAIQQLLHDVDWGVRDVLVVDLPPGTGDAQLTLVQKVPLAGAVIVSTPQDIALLDARKGLNMFRKVGIPILGLIENMSYFICPHCGQQSDIFSHGGVAAEAKKMETDLLGSIPLELSLRQASDAGKPLVITQPQHAISQTFLHIARNIWHKIA